MNIPRDKRLHFITGAGGGFLMTILGLLIGLTPFFSVCAGTGLGIVAGIGKEIYDHFHPEAHTAEILDAVSTITGAIVGSSVAILFSWVLTHA